MLGDPAEDKHLIERDGRRTHSMNATPAVSEDSSSNAVDLSNVDVMMYGSSLDGVLYESDIYKQPRGQYFGFRKKRYLVLSMRGHGVLNLSYYENEFAYSSYQSPMGEIKLLPETVIKKLDVLHEKWIQIVADTVREKETELRFICPTAPVQLSWHGELSRAVAYLRYLKSPAGRLARKSVPIPMRGVDSGSGTSFDDTDTSSTASVSSAEAAGGDGASIVAADDMNLDSLMMFAKKQSDVDDEKEEEVGEGVAVVLPAIVEERESEASSKGDDAFISKESNPGSSTNIQMVEIKKPIADDKLKGIDVDLSAANYCEVVDDLEAKIKDSNYFSSLKSSQKGRTKKHLKQQLARVKQLAKVVYNWIKLVVKVLLIKYARSGELPFIRRFLELLPDTECYRDMLYEDDVLPNLSRSAARYGHKDLLKWLVEKKGVDVNNKNRMGFPLVIFAVISVVTTGKFDVAAEMLRFMVEDLGADINARNLLGQSALFFCVGKLGSSVQMFEHLVKKYKIDPTEVDQFNCTVMHTAVLWGHLDMVKYLYEKKYASFGRARWAKLMDMYESIGFLPPEIAQARLGWRARGLVKYSNDASPLGVAILHNNGRIAKFLMGFGSTSVECSKRKNIFANSCQDLEMVALAWPELLPDVLNSFEMITAEAASKSLTVGAKNAGGFVEAKYAIADILGDPSVPTVLCPLAIFCRSDAPEVFDTPILQLVLKLKWETFGKKKFFFSSIPYAVLCFCFWLGFIFDYPIGRYICYGLTLFLLLFEEMRELLVEGPSLFVKNIFNYLSVPAYFGLLYVGFRRDILGSDDFNNEDGTINAADKIVLSYSAFSLIMRLLEFLIILPQTSVFVVTVIILVRDILMWSVLFFLFIFTYASALMLLLKGEEGFTSFGSALITVFRMSVGDFNIPFSDDPTVNNAAVALWISFTFLVPLLYMNVLIAMMSKSFEQIGERASAVGNKSLAVSLVNWEATLPPFVREKAYYKVCPGAGKHATIRVSNDLGFGLWRSICRILQMDYGDGRAVITIDNNVCTMFTKNERTWKEIEMQEEHEMEARRVQEIADMKGMLQSMSGKMSEKLETGLGVLAEQMSDLLDEMQGEKKQVKGSQKKAEEIGETAAAVTASSDLSHDEGKNQNKMKVLRHFGLGGSSGAGDRGSGSSSTSNKKR